MAAATARVTREDMATTVSAIVYGNILVLASVLALHGDQLRSVEGLAVVGGTGVATYVAHVLSDVVAYRARTGEHATWGVVRHDLRLSSPIATATAVPVLILFAAVLGWISSSAALLGAAGYCAFRLAMLGWSMERAFQQKSSWRVFASGIGLALIGVLVAALKITLTH